MRQSKSTRTFSFICLFTLGISSVTLANDIFFSRQSIKTIEVKHDTLFPEAITYNAKSNRFVLGSFRQGAIFEVDKHGNARKIIDDERLRSVFAVSIDNKRNRLYALTSDLGVSVKTNTKDVKRYAALGIYDLATGTPVHFVDLSGILPNKEHLVNGMALDDGNAYITDSFAAAIYKVDKNGEASLFLQHDEFKGKGINLNGIVYHPDGYFLAVKKSNGVLYKIPRDKPDSFSPVASDKRYIGADGLVLNGDRDLVIIANRVQGHDTDTAFLVSSDDQWKTMKAKDEYPFGNVYPTTGTLKDEEVYIVHSKLNNLTSAPRDKQGKLSQNAKIVQIGHIK